MSKLNRDVFYLIFEKLQYNKRTLHSCLLVNKICCEIVIPILWKDPWKNLKNEKELLLLLNVIISHLSDESKNNLNNQGLNISYQKPLFNYISFCRHLNLNVINKIFNIMKSYIQEISKLSIIKNEIINLFINENTKFTHLYIPYGFDFQLHITKRCFSEIEFLSCYTSINDDTLTELIEMCTSIKELELIIESSYYVVNNEEIVKLIQGQKKLINVHYYYSLNMMDGVEHFFEVLENSLIKHANIIEHLKLNKPPSTNILSYFVNLKILELDGHDYRWQNTWGYLLQDLKDLSLPLLQILRLKHISANAITSLIKSTNKCLIEIKIDYTDDDNINNKSIIQTIYQKCPYLKYVKLVLRNDSILEFENLLIHCQYLNGLFIAVNDIEFDWDNLLNIITKSSSDSLFKLKFLTFKSIKLESLKSFFDNWKNKNPMLLQTVRMVKNSNIFKLTEKYKAKGIVKKYDNDWFGTNFEDFEWI